MKKTLLPPLFMALYLLNTVSVLRAENVSLIPQRVFFEDTAGHTELAVDEETLLKQLPNYLYSLISAGQAIVMIQEKERAHSRFAFSVKRQGETVDILIGLYKKDSLLEETVYSYTAGELEYEDFSRFAAATAERAIPHLAMVKPEVKITSLVREKELERKIEEIDFSEQLNKRHELTARVGHLVKFLHIGSEEGDSIRVDTVYTPLLPLRIDLARFKKRNNGLLFSLLIDRNDLNYLGGNNPDGSPPRSMNTYLLPGFGFTYRTLNRFSAGYNILFQFGGINIKAIDNIFYSNNEKTVLDIPAGESQWVPYSLLTLEAQLIYNLSATWALKLRSGISFMPLMLLPFAYEKLTPISADGWGYMDLLSIGICYRYGS